MSLMSPTRYQGRNFSLKSGGTNSEGERGALWSEMRGEENEKKVSLPRLIRGLGERREF